MSTEQRADLFQRIERAGGWTVVIGVVWWFMRQQERTTDALTSAVHSFEAMHGQVLERLDRVAESLLLLAQ